MVLKYETTIDEMNRMGLLSARAMNVCRLGGIDNLGQLLKTDVSSLLKISHCGQRTIMEIQNLKGACHNDLFLPPDSVVFSQEKDFTERQIEKRKVLVAMAKEVQDREKLSNEAGEKYKQMDFRLKIDFRCRVLNKFERLTVRAKNAFPQYNQDIMVVLQDMYTATKDRLLDTKNIGRKTVEEIESFLNEAKTIFEELVSKDAFTQSPPRENKNDDVIVDLKIRYPFLSNEECKAVAEFLMEKGHIPYLFIAKKYIQREKSSYNAILCDFYGLNESGVRQDAETIAKDRGLSSERVRQITTMGIDLQKLFGENFSDDIFKCLGNVMAVDSPCWEKLQSDNMLNEPFIETASLVLALSSAFTLLEIKGDNKKYVVNKDILVGVKFLGAKTSICREIELRRTKVKRLDILEYIKGNKDVAYHEDVHELCPIFANYIKHKYGEYAEVEADRYVVLSPNAVDKSHAIQLILEQQGRPMTLNELFSAYNTLYPSHAFDTLSKIKPYILQNPHIKAKGNAGIYMLDEWEGLFTGTLTDYLEQILDEFGKPMKVDELFLRAKKEYPNTTIKSVISLAFSSGRFVVYKGNIVGLSKNDSQAALEKQKAGKRRHSFGVRFDEFRAFVDAHKRMPNLMGDEEEKSLAHWKTNVKSNIIDCTQEQRDSLERFISENQSLPQNGTEDKFLQMCDAIKVFVSKNLCLPKIKEMPSEYTWLMKNLKKYSSYADNRKRFFEELLEYLKDYGFYL